MAAVVSLFFWLIPIGILALFIVSLCMLCVGKRKQRTNPGAVSQGQITTFLVLTVVSGAIVGLMLIVVLVLIIAMLQPISFM